MKRRLNKYPFLSYLDIICTNKKDKILYNYWTHWKSHGWNRIWHKFLKKLFKAYDRLSADEKKIFKIVDCRQQFGKLHITLSYTNDEIDRLVKELENESEWVCCVCGKKYSSGVIYRTKDWIFPLCKKHIKKFIRFDDIEKYKVVK